MTDKMLPAITGKQQPCLHAGRAADEFPADGRICVGFGSAFLSRDGLPVWQENGQELDECMTGAQAEEMAAADPDHDWRICLFGPLSGREYQRHAPGCWPLIHQDEGFA